MQSTRYTIHLTLSEAQADNAAFGQPDSYDIPSEGPVGLTYDELRHGPESDHVAWLTDGYWTLSNGWIFTDVDIYVAHELAEVEQE